jgi:hypothetical protein
MTLSSNKTRVITSTRKTYALNCKYKLCEKYVTHTEYVRGLGVGLLLDSKLPFHYHVDSIFFSIAQNVGTHTYFDVVVSDF